MMPSTADDDDNEQTFGVEQTGALISRLSHGQLMLTTLADWIHKRVQCVHAQVSAEKSHGKKTSSMNTDGTFAVAWTTYFANAELANSSRSRKAAAMKHLSDQYDEVVSDQVALRKMTIKTVTQARNQVIDAERKLHKCRDTLTKCRAAARKDEQTLDRVKQGEPKLKDIEKAQKGSLKTKKMVTDLENQERTLWATLQTAKSNFQKTFRETKQKCSELERIRLEKQQNTCNQMCEIEIGAAQEIQQIEQRSQAAMYNVDIESDVEGAQSSTVNITTAPPTLTIMQRLTSCWPFGKKQSTEPKPISGTQAQSAPPGDDDDRHEILGTVHELGPEPDYPVPVANRDLDFDHDGMDTSKGVTFRQPSLESGTHETMAYNEGIQHDDNVQIHHEANIDVSAYLDEQVNKALDEIYPPESVDENEYAEIDKHTDEHDNQAVHRHGFNGDDDDYDAAPPIPPVDMDATSETDHIHNDETSDRDNDNVEFDVNHEQEHTKHDDDDTIDVTVTPDSGLNASHEQINHDQYQEDTSSIHNVPKVTFGDNNTDDVPILAKESVH